MRHLLSLVSPQYTLGKQSRTKLTIHYILLDVVNGFVLAS